MKVRLKCILVPMLVLGRKLRHGDSINLFMPQTFIDELFALQCAHEGFELGQAGSASWKLSEQSDLALDSTEQTSNSVGKLLWLAFVRPDCSLAVK